MPYPTNIHPLQRQPNPSRIGSNVAVQPYKRKPLRSAFSSFRHLFYPGQPWEPDLVRFKGGKIIWEVQTASDNIITLRRSARPENGRYRAETRTIWRRDEHKLEVVYQPPRRAGEPK